MKFPTSFAFNPKPKVQPAALHGGRAAAAFAASLRFDSVEKRYGEADALAGISLEIAPGEIVCLLGPSGCGKTTLLRVASGIERPTAGRVLINDREVAGPGKFVPPEQRSVGLMFQDFALFPHLSVLQNVAFGLKDLPREEALGIGRALLARVDMQRYGDEYPHTLSGGQQQRVALARALAPRPSVVLMDEPFSGLDVQLRDSMQEETLTLLRETRATCMIVTHHPDEAMRLGDRIAVMRAGRIIQVGTAEGLYHHPAELAVARLFSEINEIVLPARGGFIETAAGRVAAPGVGDGEKAVLCLRERGIHIRSPGAGLPGRVLHVKFMGDVAVLDIGVDGFDIPLRVRAPERQGLTKGADIGVEIDLARALVFSEKSLENNGIHPLTQA